MPPVSHHHPAPHVTPRQVRLKVLFYVALVAVVLLTIFTIHYNWRRETRAPLSDLINIMKQPLTNSNVP